MSIPPPTNFGPIIPLSGGSHVHRFDNGRFHLTDNLSGGQKNYYDLTPDGSITGIRGPTLKKNFTNHFNWIENG
jgi:hypothetical protein